MTTAKISGLLGIAQRAGYVTSGSNLIINEVKKRGRGRQWLVLVARDALTATGADLVEKCLRTGISVFRLPMDKRELGLSIGKNQRSCVMIKDSGIAGRIMALLEEMEVRPLEQS